jgi:hypothetical protein
MHSPQILAAMQQLFDGVIEFSFLKTGLKIMPMLRVAKMRGMVPRHEYYSFFFDSAGMQLGLAEAESEPTVAPFPSAKSAGPITTSLVPLPLTAPESRAVFEYLAKSFIEDYKENKQAIEQSGWRTRIAVSRATGLNSELLYGREGRFGPVMKELISSGLVETRFFSGQRGRGGEVTKMRVAYEKENVKRIVDSAAHRGAS